MHRILQYIALILIFTAMAGGYWYWKSQAAVRINQGLEDSLEQGLVGYWKLDDASGTTATDSSGNGNNGTLTNGPAWTTGQVGGGVTFDGVDDRIVSVSNSPQIASLTKATVSFWVNPTQIGGIFNTLADDFGGNGPFSGGFEITKDHWHGTQTIRLAVDGSAGDMMTHSTAALPLSTWTHVTVVWDGTLTSAGTKFYYNGITAGTTTQENGSGTYVQSDGRFKMGILTGGNGQLNGSLDEVRVYNRTLSDEEVSRLYQTTAPTGIDTGLVGYWPFDGDDISGTTTSDRSGKGNNGTLTNGPTKTIGKSGQALNFDGTDDYVTIPHQSYMNSYPLTVSAWFKTSGSSSGSIVNKYVGTSLNGYQIHMYQGQLCAWYFKDGGNYIFDNSSNCTFYLPGYNDNNWHQATFVVDASGGKLYVDGVLGGSLAWTGTPGWTTTTQPLSIGNTYVSYFSGSIDETRIYNRALTAAEVQDLYQKTQSNTVGASNKRDSLALGLAGYWKLDDVSGTTAIDSSTNGNNGTLTNGPTWTAGQIQGAANFDGVDDYINAGSPANLDNLPVFSASAWIYQPTASVGYRKILSKGENNFTVSCPNGGWCLSTNGTELNFGLAYASGNLLKRANSGVVPFDQWNHVVVTWDGTASSSGTHMYVNGFEVTYASQSSGSGARISDASWNVSLGALHGGAQTFYGKIDETRIYNRVLTADEISRLYQTTAPTGVDTGLKGYWSFDQNSLSGTTASDWSGAGNNGTLTNGPTKTIGKIGQALNFWPNGTDTDAHVNVGDPTSGILDFGSGDFSVGFWMKSAGYINQSSSANMPISKRNNDSANAAGYVFRYGSDNKMALYVGNGTGEIGLTAPTATTSDNQWHHYVGQRSGGTVYLYVDGVQVASGTLSGSVSNSNLFAIGSDTGVWRNVQGPVDEVRVYNRALTVDEIREEYDYGKADKVNTAASDPLTDSLTGYWKLDDASGTTATDSSGNGNNGTLTNGPTWTTGQIGGALSLDGVDDYATVPYSSSLVGTDKLSYSFWIKPDLNEGAGILGGVNGENGTGNNFIIIDNNGSELNNPSISMYRDIGGSFAIRGASFASPTNTWIHGVYTYDGAAERWYINGTKLGEWTQAGIFLTNTEIGLLLGCVHSGACNYKGLIDEVRVYKRALTTEDVAQLYRTTAPTGVDTSLVGYWPFDGDDFSGTTTYDRSGKGNNGTLTNGPTKTIGKIGQALNFDGSDDNINIANQDYLGQFSFSTWFYTGNNSQTGMIFGEDTGSGATASPKIGIASGNFFVRLIDSGSSDTAVAVPEANQWHHLVVVRDSNNKVDLYVDGIGSRLFGDAAVPATYTLDRIAMNGLVGDQNFSGKLDETRIYNRALTSAEIQNLYLKGR